MATKTRTQLVNRAAQRIGVLPAGQTLSAEDGLLIDEQIDAMCSELAARGVVGIADPTVFEEAFFLPLADILGYWVAADFGVNLQELVGLGVDGNVDGACEKRLRKVQASQPGQAPVQGTYY